MKRKHLILHAITLLVSAIFLSHTYHEAILAILRHNYILFIFLGLAPFLMALCSFCVIFNFIANPSFHEECKYSIKTSFIGTIIIVFSLLLTTLILFFVRGESAEGVVFLAYFALAFEFMIISVSLIFSYFFDKKRINKI